MRLQAQDHLFVVGTEEGHIHKCSQAYNSEYLQTYQGDLLLPQAALQGCVAEIKLNSHLSVQSQEKKLHCFILHYSPGDLRPCLSRYRDSLILCACFQVSLSQAYSILIEFTAY